MDQSQEERAEARRRRSTESIESFRLPLLARLGAGYDVQVDLSPFRPQITIERGHNQCSVGMARYAGALHYVVSVVRDSNCLASGETRSLEEALNAVEEWFGDVSLSAFSERYPFADPTFTSERRETLRQFREEVIALGPSLKGLITYVPQKHGSPWPFDHLQISAGARSCRLAQGKDQFWVTSLSWNSCELCNGKAATMEQILVPIQLWICDQAMPSKLTAELPWMKIINEEIIPYFEEDKSWEGICFLSWKSVEDFYAEYWKEPQSLKELQNLMAEMRSQGYDKTLRAGTSLWSLILSRSRTYGLRPDQPRLTFHWTREAMEVWPHPDGTGRSKFASREYTPEIDALLKQLEAHEID